ncbi:MAG TPA: TRIC cation channel family protein [Actinomycetota bacterium]|nr:TRIC cation channel family protein [Actinomycetota bacterium]
MNLPQAAEPIIGLPVAFDAIAITVGALSGALHATRRELSVVGILFIAFATGLGGGAIRDIVIQRGTPAFLTNPSYLLFAAIGSLIAFFFARRARNWKFAYDALDVATLGVWVLLGCQKAIAAGLPAIAAVFVGVVASVGGGLLRDLLCGDVPAAFRPGQWLAFASLLASLTYVTMNHLDTAFFVDESATILVASVLRFAAIRWDIRTPVPFDLVRRVKPGPPPAEAAAPG